MGGVLEAAMLFIRQCLVLGFGCVWGVVVLWYILI